MKYLHIVFCTAVLLLVIGGSLLAQIIGGGPNGGSGAGTCGGDLTGSYPNCVVNQIQSAAIPASATVLGTNSSKQTVAATLQGIGTKVLTETGSCVNGHAWSCDANGTAIDSGVVPGGGGGSGTVNGSTINFVAYYAATGTAVSGETTITLGQTHAYTNAQSTMAAMTNFGAL